MMQHEQTFDVLLIRRAERHGLVDDQVLGAGYANWGAGDLQPLRCRQRFDLKRQPCDRQIHVDTAGVVREQHHLIRVGEGNDVGDTRNDSVLAEGVQQLLGRRER